MIGLVRMDSTLSEYVAAACAHTTALVLIAHQRWGFVVIWATVVCLEPVSLVVFDLACDAPLRGLRAIWMRCVATKLKYIVDKNVRMLYTARSQNLHLQQFIFRIS